MRILLLLLWFCSSSLFLFSAEELSPQRREGAPPKAPTSVSSPIDRSARSFEMRSQKKRVDRFDFSGEFSYLENIDIDARRKKCVELDVSGEYPLLREVSYEGSFGSLRGDFTGNYPLLSTLSLLCTNCAMQLDCTGKWHKDCQITIRGGKEPITLYLPEEVGLIIHTKTTVRGKVVAKEGLKQESWFQFWNKSYRNELAGHAPITLTIEIVATDGTIFLK